jgi:hypothetical protein
MIFIFVLKIIEFEQLKYRHIMLKLINYSIFVKKLNNKKNDHGKRNYKFE